MDDGRDIFWALAGFGAGVWGFFWGFTRLRRKRLIENIPTSTVRGLALGLVELIGRAKITRKLKSPLTQTDCVFYRYTVERLEKRGKSSSWVTIAKGNSSFSPFWLDDTTGKIAVFPNGAEIIIPCDYTFQTGWGRVLAQNLIDFMEENAIACRGIFGIAHTLRFREWFIREDETIYALGTAEKSQGGLGDYNSILLKRIEELKNDAQKMSEADLNKDGSIDMAEWDRAVANIERVLLEERLGAQLTDEPMDVVIKKGEAEKTFIISDRSQKDLTQKLAQQALGGIFGGAALALAMTAYLLFRLAH